MCGFVGVFNKHPLTQTADQEELIKQMKPNDRSPRS